MTTKVSPPATERPVPLEIAVAVLEAQQQRTQTVLARMAEWSARVKGWCAGLLGALGALTAAVAGLAKPPAGSVTVLVAAVLAVGLVAVAGGWLLDAYYLHLERWFRPARDQTRRLLVDILDAGTAAGVSRPQWNAALTLPTPPRGWRANWSGIRAATGSLAVLPYYTALLMMLLVPATVLAAVLLAGEAR